MENANKQFSKNGFEFAKREFIEHQNKRYVGNINFNENYFKCKDLLILISCEFKKLSEKKPSLPY